ncbi:YgaP family membrane protein [Flavobacterium caeni]|uniref:YgaP family membrane protein n=1 Tax=Flavobacterium caeni TaxID=490189 RepID=UPI000B86CBC2|nr:DUF2892 domain-containing protein [Flavobacterium caeni]
MKKNMGNADRLIRILIAISIGVLYYTGVIDGTVAIVLGVLAIVFLLTSFISFCPLYVPFGITTCKARK